MTHPWWLILILFLGGQLAYVLKRAAMAIRNPDNPVATRWEYLSKNWDVLVVRIVVGQLLFWAWVTWPDGLTKILSYVHISFDLNIPVIPVVAAGAGLAMDAILDWLTEIVPALGRIVPKVQSLFGGKS